MRSLNVPCTGMEVRGQVERSTLFSRCVGPRIGRQPTGLVANVVLTKAFRQPFVTRTGLKLPQEDLTPDSLVSPLEC